MFKCQYIYYSITMKVKIKIVNLTFVKSMMVQVLNKTMSVKYLESKDENKSSMKH